MPTEIYRYEDAIRILKILLSKIPCDRRRGYWTLRLSVDLEHMGRPNESISISEGGVIDPWVRAGSKFALQRRVLRLSKPPRRWKIPSYADYVKRNIKEVHITLIVINGKFHLLVHFIFHAKRSMLVMLLLLLGEY